MNRPEVEMLTSERIESIVEDAIRVLSRTGVFVENDEAMALLDEAGAKTIDGRVLMDEGLVYGSLKTAPGRIVVRDRDGEVALDLGDRRVHFDPGSAAIHILDPASGRRRPPTVEDVAALARVTEACRHIQAQATALVPADVPGEMADRIRLFIALTNSRKPVVTGTFRKDGFAVMKEMLVAVRGDESALREAPLAIFDCCPTPPLKWSDLTCQAMIDCARSGIPAEMVSMPLSGATAPVTLREMVVQHTAECMSGVVIHQLAAAGSPIIWGGSPSGFDMRHGTTPMGAIETMMVDMAYAQVGRRLGLPTHAYMALSDAKGADWQAGMETGVGAVLAALAGINMVSGPGMLDFESCQSLEKLVLDNEACGMALRLVEGISDRSAGQAADLIHEVVHSGHFLANRHTRENFRKELLIPSQLINRATYGDWEKEGGKNAFERAADMVGKILEKGNPAPLPDDRQAGLERLMLAEASRLGVRDLRLPRG